MHNLDYKIKDVAESKNMRWDINPEIIYSGTNAAWQTYGMLNLYDNFERYNSGEVSLRFSRLLPSDQSVTGIYYCSLSGCVTALTTLGK